MSHEGLFVDLALWRELGWLRVLDEQFALFLARLEPEAPEDVLLLAALVSHQLGRGHVCLPLARFFESPLDLLGLPPEESEQDQLGKGSNGLADSAEPEDVTEQRREDALARLEDRLQALGPGALRDALTASNLVSVDGGGTTPLVFDRDNLYFRRGWTAETRIAAAVQARSEDLQTSAGPAALGQLIREIFGQSENMLAEGAATLDWQQVACALAARSGFCIVTGGPGTGKTWTVVRIIALLQRLHANESGDPLRIRLAAPTGKAAQRLSESISAGWESLGSAKDAVGVVAPEHASTLHRLLGSQRHTRHFRHDRSNPLPADVVIVDEASMIDQEMMQSLLDALAPTTRLILLGDKDQLASVEAGAVFGDLCRDADDANYSPALNEWLEKVLGTQVGGAGPGGMVDRRVMLRENHRSTAQINALAEAVNAGDADRAVNLLQNSDGDELGWAEVSGTDAEGADKKKALERLVLHGNATGDGRNGYLRYLDHLHETRRALGTSPSQAGVDEWAAECLQTYSRFQVLTALKRGPWGVDGINRQVYDWLRARRRDGEPLIGSLSGDQTGIEDSELRNDQWFDGRPVMITRNDYSTGLMNGDIGLCVAIPIKGELRLRVVFRRGENDFRYFAPSRLRDCQTAWAMTVHKSQGSEFQHVVLVLPDQYSRVLTRELIYTGITRARDRITVVAPDSAVFERAVRTPTLRDAGLASRLGFGETAS